VALPWRDDGRCVVEEGVAPLAGGRGEMFSCTGHAEGALTLLSQGVFFQKRVIHTITYGDCTFEQLALGATA